MKKLFAALVCVPVLSCSALASAQVALYPSGPDQDAAFIRFVNATTEPLDVIGQAGQPPLRLETATPASLLFAVDSTKPLKGFLVSGTQKLELDLQVQPGEFATIVVVPQGTGIEQVAVRETPDDFNGLKASLAFVNVDKSCSDASLRPAGRSADLFKAVAVGSLQRRSINPVNLSVQLVCANTNVGAPLDLGMLKAGERYSVMLVPSASGPRLLSTTDTLSH